MFTFDGVYLKWAQSWAHKNAWRIQPEMDVDDLVQEAFLVFERVREHYPDVTNPAHFFCLFRTAMINQTHRLASQRQRRWRVELPSVGYRAEEGDPFVAAEDPRSAYQMAEIDLAIMIEDAPEPIARLVRQLVASEVHPRRRVFRGRPESLACYLARIAGVSESVDLTQHVRSFLAGEAT